MKIHVAARPGRKNEYIKYVGRATFQIAVKEPPVKSKSNAAIIEKLSEYLDTPKSQIKLIHGHGSKQKVFEVPVTQEDLDKLSLDDNPQIKLF
ncbi:DUF167 domain-containing protein [Candidatus Daviesbacteria bacterium]|nr:DUF167 domain-containing protein [Candidatus Daviesbacteria bacterium]